MRALREARRLRYVPEARRMLAWSSIRRRSHMAFMRRDAVARSRSIRSRRMAARVRQEGAVKQAAVTGALMACRCAALALR